MKISPFYQFLVGFVFSLLILLTAVSYSYYSSKELYENFDWVEHTYRVIQNLKNIEVRLTQMESNARGFYITKDNKFKENYEGAKSLLDIALYQLDSLTADNKSQEKNIELLRALFEKRISYFTDALYADVKVHVYTEKRIDDIFYINKRINNQILTIENEEKVLLKQRQTIADINLYQSHVGIIVSGIVAIVLSLLVFFIIRKDYQRKKIVETELRNLNEDKNKFFSVISHDLRGPVGSIFAMTKLLIDPQNTTQPNSEILRMLNATSQKAKDLLEDLLTWSKSQMNGMSFIPSAVSLKEMLQTNIAYASALALNKNIALTCESDRDVMVYVDKNMVNTILRNLIHNAIKFTHKGGCISVGFEILNKKVVVCVQDNGVGISEKQLMCIFRLDQSATTVGTDRELGTGLGLIICKDFAIKNGGDLWVKSKVGTGTKFYFSLQLAIN